MGQPSPEATARYRSKPEVRQARAEYQRWRRATHPDKCREIQRKSERKRKIRSYGLTLKGYEEMLTQQNNACAICKTSDSGKRDWHIDHCHETQTVRGLLCHHCNLMLGNAKDNMQTLAEAIKYLGRF